MSGTDIKKSADRWLMGQRSEISAGIVTLKNSGLAAFGARGMCLFASPLPVIIFSKEAPTRRRSRSPMSWDMSPSRRAASADQ